MKEEQTHKISRREFIRYGSCGAMGIGSLVNVIAQLQLINSATASTLDIGSDYKALVCVFLSGGCDMNNVLIPVNGNEQAYRYLDQRGYVSIPNGVVHNNYNAKGANETILLNPRPALNQPFGLHPSLQNLANMFNSKNAAFLANVGTLGEPTNPSNYGGVSLPRQLFSHSDQQTEWMSSIADQPFRSGWGARVADLFNDTWNPNSPSSMLITASGTNKFLTGSPAVSQYAVSTRGATSLFGYQKSGDSYGKALNGNGNYLDTREGQRLKAFERIMAYSHSNIIEDSYATVVRRARETEGYIIEANNSQPNGFDLDGIFKSFRATSGLAEEFKTIARLIAGRRALGNTRQIFFVQAGGYDTHQDMKADLQGVLRNLDNCIGAFNQSMVELDRVDRDFSYDSVTSFQASDFNRTWTANGGVGESAGTDHAWGSHAFVYGGAVKGGKIYGEFPELAVGGLVAIPGDNRGRWIPTTAVDQYAAILARWFGVPPGSTEMDIIFPNLSRFANPFTSETNLDFLDTTT
ncbi:MAG: DUF1501 domain-containing protein [Verrucomicrobiota bacterium]